MHDERAKFHKFGLVLAAAGAVVRTLLMTCVHPASTTPMLEDTYIQTARDMLQFNIHALGDRVPVYPLLVALCGVHPRVIWIAQSIMGIAASLMIFDMAVRRTRHYAFSLFVGLACSLIPEMFYYESSILTEALAGFLLVATFWLISRNGDAESGVRHPLAIGTLVALAGLTRPVMLSLVPVYFLFLVPLWPVAQVLRRENIKKAVSFALPIAVLVLGWCTFNYFNNGYFTPTTRAGQQLMDQVDPYVALAPDRFATLRDAWLRARQEYNPTGLLTSEEVYAGVLPLVQKQTGQTEAQISRDLSSLAVYMEIHFPAHSLRRAELGWIQFWGQPSPEEYLWPPDGQMRINSFLLVMSDFLIRDVKAVFLILSLISIVCAFIHRQAFSKLEYLTFAVAVWISVFASFTEYGDNRRFCVPLYMLIVYTVGTRLWLWMNPLAERKPRVRAD